MKAIVTGMNGTVAPVLARTLIDAGHTVIAWDRSRVPTDNREAVRDFIHGEHPDWFFHVATGSPDEITREACPGKPDADLNDAFVSLMSGRGCDLH